MYKCCPKEGSDLLENLFPFSLTYLFHEGTLLGVVLMTKEVALGKPKDSTTGHIGMKMLMSRIINVLRSHTVVETGHEIIYTTILLPFAVSRGEY